MAITLTSDMKIYEEEFNAGIYEAMFINSNIFNGASRGAITFITEQHKGNYIKNAYFSQVSNLVTRQDITSSSSVTPLKLAQVEEAAVKLHQKIGPVDVTRKSFLMAGLNPEERAGSYLMGRFIGDKVLERMATLTIIAANAAVTGQTALVNDITGDSVKIASLSALNKTRMKWGDNMAKLAAWLLHSTPFGDIWEAGAEITLESMAGALIATGQVPGLLGGGLVVSDNANLYNSGSPTTYNVLGLAAGAVLVRQSELEHIVIKELTGSEQIKYQIQGEYALTLGVDGFTWDISNGGANPTDAYLGTTDYWDKVRSETTGLPIVKLLCQAS